MTYFTRRKLIKSAGGNPYHDKKGLFSTKDEDADGSGADEDEPGGSRYKPEAAVLYDGTPGSGSAKMYGATVREFKISLKGKVPQDQNKFVSFIKQLGYKMTYSNDEAAWVVHR